MIINLNLLVPILLGVLLHYVLMSFMVYSIIRHRHRRIKTQSGIIIVTEWGDRLVDIWLSIMWPISLFTLLPTWVGPAINGQNN